MAAADEGRADRGSVTVEMVLIFPLIVMFLFLVLLAGRATDAKGDVVSAANDAARVASLQADGGAAATQAQLAAEATLEGEGVECLNGVRTDLSVEGAGSFGRGATVVVTVECDVRTSDLLLLNVGGGVMTVREVSREPVDTYRSL